MVDFNVFVIEESGEYYYSTKTSTEFSNSEIASLFRSEKAAKTQIASVIRNKKERIRIAKELGNDSSREENLLARWERANIVKIC